MNPGSLKQQVAVSLALLAMAWLAPPAAHAQSANPTFRAASSATTTSGTLVIAQPAATAANDVMIASIGVRPSTATLSPPEGWTLVRRINNASASSNSLAVYRKVAGTVEPGSYSWTFAGSTHAVGGIQAFFNVDTMNPIDVENGQTTISAKSHSTPSVTTTLANTMVVTSHTFASSRTWTPPAGMAESFDRPSGSSSSNGQSIEGNRVLQAAAGATGVKTATAAGNADVGNTHILALRPATTGPTPTPFTGTPIPVPGSFEAENFDLGGEGVAYHDNVKGNSGGLYRLSEDVDIILSADPLGGGYVVNDFETGEWLAYTINVAISAAYDVEIRASSTFSTGAFHVEIDGVNVTGPIAVPNTGSWSVFQWVGKKGVPLAAGQHVFKIVADQQYFNLNSLRLIQSANPTFRAASSAATTGGTLVIAQPAATAVNDVMIASIGVRPSTATVTAPAGWTLVRRINNASATANALAVYRKVATAEEPGSYSWTLAGSTHAVGGIQSFSGVDTASPIDVENGQTTASGLGHSTPSVTTTVANAMVVTSHTFASSRSWTPPAGMAESFDQPSGAASSTGQSIGGNRVLQAGAGATGVKTATAAGDADVGNTHILALRPATTGPTSTPFTGTPIPVPGSFEAENFDLGGEGVAYHDNTIGNAGGQYRLTEDVDIILSSDPLGGGYVVNDFETGEWLAYTINVAETATYRIEIRASSTFSNSAFHIEIDGVNATGSIVVPNTASFSVFQNVGKGGIALGQGRHVLRLVADQPYFNVNWIRITQETGRAVVGEWELLAAPLPHQATATHLLPTGMVLFYGGSSTGPDTRLWDPATAITSLIPLPGYNVFCSGHAFLADSRLLIAGGHIANDVGLPYSSTYDAVNNVWAPGPDMNAGRWYPTATTLANGDVLVVSGNIDLTVGVNPLPEVFQAASGTWRDLTGAQLKLDLYPWMHLAPNGKVFNSGPTQTTRYLDTAGTGTWTLLATRTQYRSYGSSVMYNDGRVLVMGGGDPPTNTAEVIDLNAATPSWQPVGSMAIARRQLNATLLPDGKVLVTGGTSGPGFNNNSTPVYMAEMWDPATGLWAPMASAQIPRQYHSEALLLPDGRVLSTGDDNTTRVEVYSPPYLFTTGTRPTITSAPAAVSYGQSFLVETPDTASIAKVTWIRLPSVTHAFNQNQRINRLSFSQAPGGLNVVAPSDASLAPPGHYMLFLLDGNDVPSVAKMVRIGS